jgi:hypothetical protein
MIVYLNKRDSAYSKLKKMSRSADSSLSQNIYRDRIEREHGKRKFHASFYYFLSFWNLSKLVSAEIICGVANYAALITSSKEKFPIAR